MIYTLKNYQRNAVDELKDYFALAFKRSGKTIVFKAPTGSGKTFMVSALFEELIQENIAERFCIIWATIGKGELQVQSYNAVNEYLAGNPVCTLLDESFFGSRKSINNHEIVFVNWEKLVQKDTGTGEWKNTLMKEQDGYNFLNVLDNTKLNDIKIILVVDESHIGSTASSRISEFKSQIILPNITLEMSATPFSDPDVEVNPQDVIDEGMIKEDIIVNEGISDNEKFIVEKDSELLILEKAEEKRQQLVEEYKKCSTNTVNPLVLVQIPNVDEGEAKKIVVKDFLRALGITEENGKLKLWCDNKGNFDKKLIKRLDDETSYLIFKTAVATGWDCPRAHILVKFREGKSETFEIQTIGRILRTAEAKSYNNALLDNAYIFTNIKAFEYNGNSYSPNRIKTVFSYIKAPETKLSVYEQTKLVSYYRSREGSYNSADSRFYDYYEKSFMSYFDFTEQDKICFGEQNVPKFDNKHVDLSLRTADQILAESSIETKNLDEQKEFLGGLATVKMSDSDVQFAFYDLIKSNLNGLAYLRSLSPVTIAMIDVFNKFYPVFLRGQRIAAFQRIIVNNADIFAEILSNATLQFKQLLDSEVGLKGVSYDFYIEDKKGYSLETYLEMRSKKSLYQPFYVLKKSENSEKDKLEKDFIEYLDDKDGIRWFWQNGAEWMKTNFGIAYNSGKSTFQPDFIIKFSNGKIGIFDTKAIGYNVDDTKVKAEALYQYICEINKSHDIKLVGGIVVKKGSQFYYYCEEEYVDFDESADKWKNFNELI